MATTEKKKFATYDEALDEAEAVFTEASGDINLKKCMEYFEERGYEMELLPNSLDEVTVVRFVLVNGERALAVKPNNLNMLAWRETATDMWCVAKVSDVRAALLGYFECAYCKQNNPFGLEVAEGIKIGSSGARKAKPKGGAAQVGLGGSQSRMSR